MSKEPCSNCGYISCNGIDCYYDDYDEQDDDYYCPVCERDCCHHFIETITQLTQSQARIKELEALVREMGNVVDRCGIVVLRPHLREILSRPDVRAMMEEKP